MDSLYIILAFCIIFSFIFFLGGIIIFLILIFIVVIIKRVDITLGFLFILKRLEKVKCTTKAAYKK